MSRSLSSLPPLRTIFTNSSILPFKSESNKRRKKSPELLMSRHISTPFSRAYVLITSSFAKLNIGSPTVSGRISVKLRLS